MGTVADVVDKANGRREIGVGVAVEDCQIQWLFHGEDRDGMSMKVEQVQVDGLLSQSASRYHFLLPEVHSEHEEATALTRRIRSLTYITAERIGPRDVYPLEDSEAAAVVGPRGEHTVTVLYQQREESVLPALCLKGEVPKLLHQVQARMQKFFPGCGVSVQPVPQANAVTLGLRTSAETSFHRPIHVGFGLTQVLPIVVAALSAKPGHILLIENPEVHLHPAGQALMGQFLAEVAAAGVQVLIETHSDHLLNGIRRAVKAGVVTADQTALHFFRPLGTSEEQVVTPLLDDAGNIDHWPDGFFDQFDKDMNHFAGWGD